MRNNIILAKVIKDNADLYVPFGILYIANALEKANYNCIVWHGREKELPQFYQLVKDLNPLFVGFSVLTEPSLLPTIKASRKLKEASIPTVWGGVHVTILPSLCLKQDHVDYIVIGEGEETAVELAGAIKDGGDYSRVTGLGYKTNGELYLNPPRPLIEDLDRYFPVWEKVDLNKYFHRQIGQQRVLPLITSRGCPHKCGFCYNEAVNKRRWRRHSVNFVLFQAEFLKSRYAIDGIYFDDDNFFTDVKRAKEIIEKVDLPCFAEIRADYVTDNFVDWLRTTKCRELYIGAESGSQRILDKINKDMTVDDIRSVVYMLLKTDIVIRLSFITGFPVEEKEDRDKTLNLMRELLELNPRIVTSLKKFTPYPGTPLWEETLACGLKPPVSNEEWAQFTRERVPLPWLSNEELLAMKAVTWHMARGATPDKLSRRRFFKKIVHFIMVWRWKNKYFNYPFEIIVGGYLLRRFHGLVKRVL
ncbi:B12-binding domain-containing radical SAM protein [Chloroflexota bacterium]